MSNFLTHLVQRSQMQISNLQPRLLSRFELLQAPVGLEFEPSTEQVVDPPIIPRSASYRSVPDAAPVQQRTSSVKQESLSVPHLPPSQQFITDFYQPITQRILSDSTSSNQPSQQLIDPAINFNSDRAKVQRSPKLQNLNRHENSESRQTHLLQPHPTHLLESEPAPQSITQSQPPIIKVTIGRVEVRAITSPTAVTRPAPPQPRPTLSLDDYLKARNGGRR